MPQSFTRSNDCPGGDLLCPQLRHTPVLPLFTVLCNAVLIAWSVAVLARDASSCDTLPMAWAVIGIVNAAVNIVMAVYTFLRFMSEDRSMEHGHQLFHRGWGKLTYAVFLLWLVVWMILAGSFRHGSSNGGGSSGSGSSAGEEAGEAVPAENAPMGDSDPGGSTDECRRHLNVQLSIFTIFICGGVALAIVTWARWRSVHRFQVYISGEDAETRQQREADEQRQKEEGEQNEKERDHTRLRQRKYLEERRNEVSLRAEALQQHAEQQQQQQQQRSASTNSPHPAEQWRASIVDPAPATPTATTGDRVVPMASGAALEQQFRSPSVRKYAVFAEDYFAAHDDLDLGMSIRSQRGSRASTPAPANDASDTRSGHQAFVVQVAEHAQPKPRSGKVRTADTEAPAEAAVAMPPGTATPGGSDVADESTDVAAAPRAGPSSPPLQASTKFGLNSPPLLGLDAAGGFSSEPLGRSGRSRLSDGDQEHVCSSQLSTSMSSAPMSAGPQRTIEPVRRDPTGRRVPPQKKRP